MPESSILFGPWAPDHPSFGGVQLRSGGEVVLDDAFGVYATLGGYRPYIRPGTLVASFNEGADVDFPITYTPQTMPAANDAIVWLDAADETTFTTYLWNGHLGIDDWTNKITGQVDEVASPVFEYEFSIFGAGGAEPINGRARFDRKQRDGSRHRNAYKLNIPNTGTQVWALIYAEKHWSEWDEMILIDFANEGEDSFTKTYTARVRQFGNDPKFQAERFGETPAVGSEVGILNDIRDEGGWRPLNRYDTEPFMLFVQFDGTNKIIRTNGVLNDTQASTGAFNYTHIFVGGRARDVTDDASGADARLRNWAGYLDQVVIGTTALTTEEIEKLEGWMAHKVGNTDVLPSSHPFKADAPLTNESITENVANEPTSTGMFWDDTGLPHFFVGDYTKIFKLNQSREGFDDVARTVGGTYSATRDFPWQFAQFGDRILATTKFTEPQYFDLGSSTNFENLPGSPPKARTVSQVRDFVFLGSTEESGTRYQYRVRWSGFNDSEDWTTDPGGTQADFQDLDSQYGEVMAIVGGEFATILQERAISRFTYVGPPAIFQRDTVEINRGTIAPLSVIQIGRLIYYYSHDGFWAFDGVESRRISGDLIHRWLKKRRSDFSSVQMRVGHDPDRRIIIWAWPHDPEGLDRQTSGYQVFYNYENGRWSYYHDPNLRWWPIAGPLEEEFIDNFNDPIDLDSGPIDEGLANFTRQLALQYDGDFWSLRALDGGDVVARLETAKVVTTPGRRTLLTGARVIGNLTSDTSMSVAAQSSASYPSNTLTSEGDPDPYYNNTVEDGFVPLDSEGRYHGLRVEWDGGKGSTSGDIEELDVVQGLMVEYRERGKH